MLRLFMDSIRLFLRGKLFRDNAAVFRQWLKGFALTIAVLIAVGYFGGALLGVIVASLLGGALQPWLFKNLKYN
jgi:hypothetical protein